MAEVRIKVARSGPYLVKGPIELLDAEGRAYTREQGGGAVALCRCGHSEKKPFCDGSHLRCGFRAEESAP
jgi:CDGSH-type Zn-finger protein